MNLEYRFGLKHGLVNVNSLEPECFSQESVRVVSFAHSHDDLYLLDGNFYRESWLDLDDLKADLASIEDAHCFLSPEDVSRGGVQAVCDDLLVVGHNVWRKVGTPHYVLRVHPPCLGVSGKVALNIEYGEVCKDSSCLGVFRCDKFFLALTSLENMRERIAHFTNVDFVRSICEAMVVLEPEHIPIEPAVEMLPEAFEAFFKAHGRGNYKVAV